MSDTKIVNSCLFLSFWKKSSAFSGDAFTLLEAPRMKQKMRVVWGFFIKSTLCIGSTKHEDKYLQLIKLWNSSLYSIPQCNSDDSSASINRKGKEQLPANYPCLQSLHSPDLLQGVGGPYRGYLGVCKRGAREQKSLELIFPFFHWWKPQHQLSNAVGCSPVTTQPTIQSHKAVNHLSDQTITCF